MKPIRHITIMALCLIWMTTLRGAPVTQERAISAMRTFVRLRYPLNQQQVVRGTTYAPIRAEALTTNGVVVGYIVLLQPSGYIVTSADDDCPPIKFYSSGGHFTNLPPAMQQVLFEELATVHTWGRKHAGSMSQKYKDQWQALDSGNASQAELSLYGMSNVQRRVSPNLATTDVRQAGEPVPVPRGTP